MDKVEEKNATIESTFLGREDHRIMTAYLYLKYDGGGQGFGGYGLDTYNVAKKKREGHVFCGVFILCVLNTLEVESWEKLPGTPCRVRASWNKVESIGHYLKDQWFSPAQASEELKLTGVT